MGVPLYSEVVNGPTDELSLVGVDRLIRLSSRAKPIVPMAPATAATSAADHRGRRAGEQNERRREKDSSENRGGGKLQGQDRSDPL